MRYYLAFWALLFVCPPVANAQEALYIPLNIKKGYTNLTRSLDWAAGSKILDKSS